MNTASHQPVLAEPRITTAPSLMLVGIDRSYTCETRVGIPAQWATFGPHIGKVPGQATGKSYGVSHNGTPEGSFDYLCAVEVTGSAAVPEGFTSLRLEPTQIAVFRHPGLVHEITATIDAIFKWISRSGYAMHGPVNVIEQYSEDFDPRTNAGWVNIWVPVRR